MVGDDCSIEEMARLGAGRPAPEAVVSLYRRAFREYGVAALWSRREGAEPTIAQALVIADSLRKEGDLRARALAAEIEPACRAAL